MVGDVGADFGDAGEPPNRLRYDPRTVIAAHARHGQANLPGSLGTLGGDTVDVVAGLLDGRPQAVWIDACGIEMHVHAVGRDIGAHVGYARHAPERGGNESSAMVAPHTRNDERRRPIGGSRG